MMDNLGRRTDKCLLLNSQHKFRNFHQIIWLDLHVTHVPATPPQIPVLSVSLKISFVGLKKDLIWKQKEKSNISKDNVFQWMVTLLKMYLTFCANLSAPAFRHPFVFSFSTRLKSPLVLNVFSPWMYLMLAVKNLPFQTIFLSKPVISE